MCWPANIVGAFFIALLIFDIIQKNYSALPYHGIIGICVTGLLWGVCMLLGSSIAMATLVVPLIFIGIFLFTGWMVGNKITCETCPKTPVEKEGRFVKRKTPKNQSDCPVLLPEPQPKPEPKPEPQPKPEESVCIPKLTANIRPPEVPKCNPDPKCVT
jgi:hypothetical protein